MDKMEIGMIADFKHGIEAAAEKVQNLGLKNIQYLYWDGDDISEKAVENMKKVFGDAGIPITAVFATYVGMDYSTLRKAEETGGLVPKQWRKERLDLTKKLADVAAGVGATAAACHYGAIPDDRDDPDYPDLISTTQDLMDHCEGLGLTFNLETGEDSTETLLNFLSDVGRPNLRINFDPANMILYGKSEPIKALRQVGTHVASCHVKDATWSDDPGVEWGREVPLGTGEVGIEDFIKTLNDFGYSGPLTIEREVEGEEQIRDLKAAVDLLENIKAKLS